MPVTLRTDRLVLRPWRDEDLAPFAAMNADPRVMAHFPALQTREESDASAGRIRAAIASRGWGFWAVEVAGGEPFVGFTGLSVPPFEAAFTPCTEIGWRLAPAAWGKGYATEAARAALDFAFGELGLAEVVAFTALGNARSRAVMERLGMRQDIAFDHPRVAEGNPVRRHVLYRLARQAHFRTPAPANDPQAGGEHPCS